ncbi:MAG: hypothetical protein AAF108_09435 [Planctomycetota bacterium]
MRPISDVFFARVAVGTLAFTSVGVSAAAVGQSSAVPAFNDIGLALVADPDSSDGFGLLTVNALDDLGDVPEAFPDTFAEKIIYAGDLAGSSNPSGLPAGFGNDPGFYLNTTSGIPANTVLVYINEGPLQEWDAVSGAFVDSDLVLRQTFGPQLPGALVIDTPLPGAPVQQVTGFSFAYSGGELDRHPNRQLVNPADSDPSDGDPELSPGVYRWNLSAQLLDPATDETLYASETVALLLQFDVADSVLIDAFDTAVLEVVDETGNCPDVDGNGTVDVLDVVEIIDIILLGSSATCSPAEPCPEDVNLDGAVTVSDVTLLVDIILNDVSCN